MTKPGGELLLRHYHQLRTTQGTVLLGPARYDADTQIDPSWFVDDCPLDPAAVVETLARRHGLGDTRAALAALHALRRDLEAERRPGAGSLADLPEE